MPLLYDYYVPAAKEIVDIVEKYQKAPTNKTAKTQTKRLLKLLSTFEVSYSVEDANGLMQNFQQQLKNFKTAANHDIDNILKACSPALGPRNNRPKPAKITQTKFGKQVPEILTTLKIFDAVLAARVANQPILLIKNTLDPDDSHHNQTGIQGKFSSYKKLLSALLREIGYSNALEEKLSPSAGR